jgi:hypothetical protein
MIDRIENNTILLKDTKEKILTPLEKEITNKISITQKIRKDRGHTESEILMLFNTAYLRM